MADVTELTALNTMYRKNPGKKQIDYIIIRRKHLKFNKNAEANSHGQ